MGRRLSDTLVVVHYHYRPGGVRRVIETALPALVSRWGIERINLFSGETPDAEWLAYLRERICPGTTQVFVEPTAGYLAEFCGKNIDPKVVLRKLRESIREALHNARAVWAHNLGLGRNILLAEALRKEAALAHVPVLAHHHDFFFDGRWGRWVEFEWAGFGTMEEALAALFLQGCQGLDVAVNRADAAFLSSPEEGAVCEWIPNPVVSEPILAAEDLARVRGWFQHFASSEKQVPVWVLPSRILRRKNILEAVLLYRVFNREGLLVITGGASSKDEQAYAQGIANLARENGWRVIFNALSRPGAPTVWEAIQAADALVLTSLREGFGLTLVEGAMSRRPQLVRCKGVPIADLTDLGLRGLHFYHDVVVPKVLFDADKEMKRVEMAFTVWRSSLPVEIRQEIEYPPARESALFSCMTLEGQFEVLSHAEDEVRKTVKDANPEIVSAINCLNKVSWLESFGRRVFSIEMFAERLIEKLTNAERCYHNRIPWTRLKERIRFERAEPRNFCPLET